jgi:hypothetical protein
MRTVLLAVTATLLAFPAQGASGPVLRIDFSNPGLTPSQWSMVIHPDGSGHFHAERGIAPVAAPEIMEPGNVDRDILLSEPFASRVFQTAHDQRLLSGACESHMKVAFQGWKKISYSGPDAQGGCQFNYSRDKEIQELGDSLVAVASTIIEGVRLEMLLQHDPLGLDKEMEFLTEAEKDGRVQQICAIRAILERLEGDSAVLDRVRKRARQLLGEQEK